MTKLEEELDSLFDFSEEQLQEREHHFMKKMWISVGIIVAVLVALSGSTFAMFSTSKTIANNEVLEAGSFNVTSELLLNGKPANQGVISDKRICDIGLYNMSNNSDEDRTFVLKITPTGTQGVQGYCKILVNDIAYYIVVDINHSEQENNVKTLNIVLKPHTRANVKVEFSWATLNPEIDNKLETGGEIVVENTDEETKGDSAKNNSTENGETETTVENETNEEPSSAEELETNEPTVDNQEIPKEEEVVN